MGKKRAKIFWPKNNAMDPWEKPSEMYFLEH